MEKKKTFQDQLRSKTAFIFNEIDVKLDAEKFIKKNLEFFLKKIYYLVVIHVIFIKIGTMFVL